MWWAKQNAHPPSGEGQVVHKTKHRETSTTTIRNNSVHVPQKSRRRIAKNASLYRNLTTAKHLYTFSDEIWRFNCISLARISLIISLTTTTATATATTTATTTTTTGYCLNGSFCRSLQSRPGHKKRPFGKSWCEILHAGRPSCSSILHILLWRTRPSVE